MLRLQVSPFRLKSVAYFQASIHEFAEAVRAYKVIFLHSEPQLSNLGQDLVKKYDCFCNSIVMLHLFYVISLC